MAKRKKTKLTFTAILLIVGYTCYLFVGNLIFRDSSDGVNQMSSAVHYDDLEMVKLISGGAEQIKRYEGFVVSFNKENHTPNWVAWELLGEETEGDVPRGNKFWHDEMIVGCAWHNDYKNSGYDRGHMIPAADQKWSEQAMCDCFAMSNICPQDHSLNSGAWSTLENKSRQWAKRDSAIIIVAGPIYSTSDRERIGESEVRVPSAFFKVMIAPYIEKPRGIGFIYPNMTSPGNMQNYVTTIDEVEQLVEMDFFFNLPDSLENEIESVGSFKLWNKK